MYIFKGLLSNFLSGKGAVDQISSGTSGIAVNCQGNTELLHSTNQFFNWFMKDLGARW